MSGWAELARGDTRATWVDKWVPCNENLPDLELEQYRYTLARARSAEAELKVLQDGLRNFNDLIRRVTR